MRNAEWKKKECGSRNAECGMEQRRTEDRRQNAEVGMRNEAISDLRLRIAEFGIRIDRSEV